MPSSQDIPTTAQILVIGGGPGGSYTAACLAREGRDVVLFEADKFPRYHVGESQLASLRHFLRFIDLENEFENHGFKKKVGAAFKLNRHKREGYTDFITNDASNYSWNVIRSEMDELMLQHAARSGAAVFQETRVTELTFDVESPDRGARPISAAWKCKDGSNGNIAFEWVVDASGREGILSTKYLKNRRFNQSLKNNACWGYWINTGEYKPGTVREGSPYFEALNDESGWAWFIPLHDGTTSIGIVINEEISNSKKAAAREQGNDTSLTAYYLRELKHAPQLMALIANGILVQESGRSVIKSASDYSYAAPYYAGPGYRIIGDAAAFIDPYFSSGVHLAISGGVSAAASICSSIKGECSESDAVEWHSARVGTAYIRFLMVVLSAYRQIRAQQVNVLSDIDEDNFDRAFEHFRPIIQGNTDTGKHLTQTELWKTIEFCTQAYEPSEPEERTIVASHTSKISLDQMLRASTEQEGRELEEMDDNSKKIFKSIAARKLMRTEDIQHIDNFVSDIINGLRLRLQKGALGLERV